MTTRPNDRRQAVDTGQPRAKASETALVAACLHALAAAGIWAWRNSTGAFTARYGGKTRFHRFGLKGSSDILGVLPDGRFLAVECKRPGNYLTDEQEAFLQRVRANHGIAVMVTSVGELLLNVHVEQEIARVERARTHA